MRVLTGHARALGAVMALPLTERGRLPLRSRPALTSDAFSKESGSLDIRRRQ
jgi:hypothetical protein